MKIEVDGNARATSGFHGIVKNAKRTYAAAASKNPGTRGPAEAANHSLGMLETKLI